MNLPVLTRQCGECTACCTACGIAELAKPMNTPCPHQREPGCAIYGHHPPSCKAFTCAWLAGDLPEQYRPDKAGVLFWLGTPDAITASLLRPDVPLDRVTFLVAKLKAGRSATRQRRRVLIIPSTHRVPLDDAGRHVTQYKPLGNNVFLAVS